MSKRIFGLILPLLFSLSVFAGKTGTWAGSTTHQFFPTIVQALLGNGWSLIPSQGMFGSGAMGTLTISAGTTTLTEESFYTTLTISGTGSLQVANQSVYAITCDLSNAPANAITSNGGSGTAGGAGGGAGGNGASQAAARMGKAGNGGNGGAGGTAAGTQGAVGGACTVCDGGTSGGGGAGGSGSGGAGGASRPGVTQGTRVIMDDPFRLDFYINAGAAQISAGTGGAGGGGGGGDGTSGGGGGGGGAGGGNVELHCGTLITAAGTTAGAISANGGAGGNGGTPAAGNRGGGGAGGGGAGGHVRLWFNTRTGTAVTNLIKTTGGANGAAGTGTGTGTAGAVSATVSSAGIITIFDTKTGATTRNTTGNATL